MAYIYLIRNLINGKGYVGKTEVGTIRARFSQHKKSANSKGSDALHKALRKYGFANFNVTQVVNCDPFLVNFLEKYFIKFYGTFAPTGHGYNLTEGGEGAAGAICSKETRQKISSANKNRIRTKAFCEAISRTKTGTKREAFSEEWKANLSAGKLGKKRKPFSEQHKTNLSLSKKGKATWNKGVPHSESTKSKIGAANKGRTPSLETKLKMSIAQKARQAAQLRKGAPNSHDN